MIITGIVTAVIYLLLLVFSRAEEPGPETEKVLRPLYKMALFLYHNSLAGRVFLRGREEIEQELRTLHPGESGEVLCEKYYTRKIMFTLALHLLGVIFGILSGQRVLWLLLEGTAVITFIMADRDLHSEILKRRKLMKLAYPDIVYKLLLYLHAGMTIRGAMMKLAEDHEKRKGSDAIGEEIAYTCRELKAGISEGAAYERLGRRTAVREYIRLCTLLAQNLKKGSTNLEVRLQEEAEHASYERLQESRRLGEEAGSKLLLPMGMLLLVVMLVIMIPAFSSMGA